MNDIVEQIREYLESRTGRKELRTMSPDESLLESGIVDSMVMVGLISFIEERFGFRVDEDDMVPENFETLGRIANYVARHVGSEAG